MIRFVAVVVSVALAGGVARAQKPECSAKEHYDAATGAYGLGRFGDAAQEFEKAYECKPQAALLWDAAQAHRQAGNRARAIELLKNYQHVYGSQAENGADVRRLIADLEAEQQQPAKTPEVAPAPAPAVTPGAMDNALVAAPPSKKPIYKRAWFWGAVAGGAVVLGVVIGVSAAYGTTTKNPTPSLGSWAY